VERHLSDRHQCAAVLVELAKLCRPSDPGIALAMGKRAQKIDPRVSRIKWLSFVAFDAGKVSEAARLLASVPKDVALQASEAR
jgi:hypothetical protein